MPPYSIPANGDSPSGSASTDLAKTAVHWLESLPNRSPLTIGIGGAPGTGKTSLAQALSAAVPGTQLLSLDDYYLPQEERRQLAHAVHPLLAHRGVPGTHDLGLLCDHLARLREPWHEAFEIPLFDKQMDDRSHRTRHIEAGKRPALLILEGWIVGVPPQKAADLSTPVNALEAEQDPDGVWRKWVNRALREYERGLSPLLDFRWHLLGPDWETVIGWRWQQEQQQDQPWLASREGVERFLAPYQRLCDHMRDHAREWSDRVIRLDRDHGLIDGNST